MKAFEQLLAQRDEFHPRPRTRAQWERLPEFLREEVDEFEDALIEYCELLDDPKADLAEAQTYFIEMIDGLMDVIYFALGGLVGTGVPAWKLAGCWQLVHAANMRKKPSDSFKQCDKGLLFQRPNELMQALVCSEKLKI